jgi:tubulin--tyrosine ligase
MAAPSRRMRVLITNDDGPPSGTGGHSPFIYPFARALMTHLNWDVRVVVPASQRSWVGKSYLIAEKVTGAYYYPRGEDGTEGETRELPRPIGEGEMEWVLLDGTPGEYPPFGSLSERAFGRLISARSLVETATCSSIALHNLFPANSFDLVISG